MFIPFETLLSAEQITHASVNEYVSEFLTSQHPFREGPVCPFVPKALKQQKICYGLTSSTEPVVVDSLIDSALLFQLNQNQNGAIILLFPDKTNSKIVSAAQLRKKLKAVDLGLMLGALSLDDNSPSLHSSKFFPLRAPEPIIVIRDMVYTDLVFLSSEIPNRADRKSFLQAYINRFQGQASDRVQENIARAYYLMKGL